MGDQPPPYEEGLSSTSKGRNIEDMKTENGPYSLVDQATASRSMLVSAAAEKIHTVLEQRAFCGISKTRVVVIPFGHECNLSGPYKIAEFDEKPIVIELIGELNSAEFWSQAEAIDGLRRQVASRICGGRGSMLQVRVNDIHVRYETPFGLYDTVNVMAIVVEMD